MLPVLHTDVPFELPNAHSTTNGQFNYYPQRRDLVRIVIQAPACNGGAEQMTLEDRWLLNWTSWPE